MVRPVEEQRPYRRLPVDLSGDGRVHPIWASGADFQGWCKERGRFEVNHLAGSSSAAIADEYGKCFFVPMLRNSLELAEDG